MRSGCESSALERCFPWLSRGCLLLVAHFLVLPVHHPSQPEEAMRAPSIRQCGFCDQDLDRLCRSDQIFCKPRCKHRARRARVKEQADLEKARALRRRAAPPLRAEPSGPATAPAAPTLKPPAARRGWQEGQQRFAALAAEMLQSADAVSYRLARAIKHTLKPTFFPEPGKPCTRLDGRVSDAPYRLRPEFEPPTVPEDGLYAVQLLDASGREVRLPRSLYRGVTLPKWPPDAAPASPESAQSRIGAAELEGDAHCGVSKSHS